MKPLLFDIYNLSHKDTAVKAATRAFAKAGAEVVSVDIDAKTKKTSGVEYREVQFSFADSQQVRFGMTATGDVAQVQLNGKPIPIKAQDDQLAAVKEIVAAMNKGRAKFQQAQAKIKLALPATIRTAAPRLEKVWTDKVRGITDQISDATTKRDALKAQLA